MREHNLKKENVLGINVSSLRPEKAVAFSLEAMRSHGLHTIFFLSAEGLLYCQETSWAMELINSHDLVFPADQHTEMALLQKPLTGDNGSGSFTDEYMKRFLLRLNREYRNLFLVSPSEEKLEVIRDYFHSDYPNITIEEMLYEQEAEGAGDKVVNEINAHIPDVVFLLLPAEDALMFVKNCEPMINAGLLICLESFHSYIFEKTEEMPSWVRRLHLESLYRLLHREIKLESKIVGTVFKKRVNEDIYTEKEDVNQDSDNI